MTQIPANSSGAPGRSGRRGERHSVELGALFDRLPPHSVETEMALLGSMILDPKVIGDVILIVKSPEDFYRPAHGAVFASLVELYDRHAAGDIALLHQRLEEKGVLADVGGVDYLVQLAESVPAAINAPYYAKVVAEKALVRRLIGAAGEILQAAYTDGGEVRDVLDAAQRAIFDVVLQFDHEGTRSLNEIIHEVMESIHAREEGRITGLETHFRGLDEKLSGLQAGEMIIIAARPSMGKTALALNIAENIAMMSTPVGVFSLEMGKQQLGERLLASHAEVDSGRLRRNMITKPERDRLAFAMGRLSEAPLFIDDTPGLSVLGLRAKARRMVAKHQVKLIIVDYLQLMMGMTRESRQQEVAEISRGVKSLARELNIPVICLSQLNRAAENREDHRPRMADLRESGSIEQDADVVMMLHREDYYNQSKPDFEPSNIAELIVAKQRNGPTGTVELTWVGTSMKFKDFSPMMPPVEAPRGPRGSASPYASAGAAGGRSAQPAAPADLSDDIPI